MTTAHQKGIEELKVITEQLRGMEFRIEHAISLIDIPGKEYEIAWNTQQLCGVSANILSRLIDFCEEEKK